MKTVMKECKHSVLTISWGWTRCVECKKHLFVFEHLNNDTVKRRIIDGTSSYKFTK